MTEVLVTQWLVHVSFISVAEALVTVVFVTQWFFMSLTDVYLLHLWERTDPYK